MREKVTSIHGKLKVYLSTKQIVLGWQRRGFLFRLKDEIRPG